MWPMNYTFSERQDMMDGGHEPGGIDGIRGEFSYDPVYQYMELQESRLARKLGP